MDFFENCTYFGYENDKLSYERSCTLIFIVVQLYL